MREQFMRIKSFFYFYVPFALNRVHCFLLIYHKKLFNMNFFRQSACSTLNVFKSFLTFFSKKRESVIKATDSLSVGTLFRKYWGKISVTWGLTLCETAMMALLPLLIGRAIDGLLAQEFASFGVLLCSMAAAVACIVARRAYDTRAYGTMRVEIGKALAQRSSDASVSVRNARVLMSRELVDFLEFQAPHSVMSIIRIFVSIIILFSFSITLAISAGFAIVGILIIYGLAAHYFFVFHGRLNSQTEMQVNALEGNDILEVSSHFQNLRRNEIKISDLESLVCGLIFSLLFCMLAFNIWFTASKNIASPGQIFSVVMYSYQFVNSAMSLPYSFQALTRLKEITARINQP
ncbi:MAG: ABC transporter six-transmembrane domain-containing protein [Pseudomonadota bacterium]